MTEGESSKTPQKGGPQGREAVVSAILDACERLSEHTVPSSFTIVDLAQEAKITTSLLYFYFDSKDAIVAATLQKIASEADELASQYDDPADMALAVRRFMWRRPAFPRIVTSIVLEGGDVTEVMGSHPFLQRLMATEAAQNPDDSQSSAARAIISILAISVYGPPINRTIGRELYDPRIAGLNDE